MAWCFTVFQESQDIFREFKVVLLYNKRTKVLDSMGHRRMEPFFWGGGHTPSLPHICPYAGRQIKEGVFLNKF